MRKFVIILILLIPVLAFAQDNSKKKAYFFYLDTCPHCHNVDKYFQDNGIYDKYDITKMDAINPFNANLLSKFYDASGEPGKGGVPAVAFGDKFIVGDQPIIDNFVKDIEAASNASELPDPSNISGNNGNVAVQEKNSESKQAADPSAENGNKKNIFPVLIIAIVLLGGGALIFINRKK
jgi:hypothetical protein